jgi:hypothetical protein
MLDLHRDGGNQAAGVALVVAARLACAHPVATARAMMLR